MVFKPGQSGNPNGRKPGAVSKMNRDAKLTLEKNAEKLIAKVIELAMGGDVQAMKMCLDRISPTLRSVEHSIKGDTYESLVERLRKGEGEK